MRSDAFPFPLGTTAPPSPPCSARQRAALHTLVTIAGLSARTHGRKRGRKVDNEQEARGKALFHPGRRKPQSLLQFALFAACGVLAWSAAAFAQQTPAPPVPPAAIPNQPTYNPRPRRRRRAAYQPAPNPATRVHRRPMRNRQIRFAFACKASCRLRPRHRRRRPQRPDQALRGRHRQTNRPTSIAPVAQAHKNGCAARDFSPCSRAVAAMRPITSQIQQMRGNLDHMMSDLEQLKSGSRYPAGPAPRD